jgi:tetratricopeptide (TPR) repeat protein
VEFVGRDEELSLLIQPPGDGPRISVIEGMAGVGKTALAIHAARAAAAQYPDGTFYLNFQTHDPGLPSLDAAEALHRLLRMLTAPATQIPDAIGERAGLLRAQLSRRRAIVILDDVAGADQIKPLLPTSGQGLVLITTRRTLSGLPGVHALILDVLSVTDALTLFRQVAGQGRAPDEDAARRTVELCGRLPLAIQLAAGRLAHEYPPRLADLVEELAWTPALASSAASPQVMSAFDVSYRSLQSDHQQFFRRLGMSPCASVGLEAAAALGGVTQAEAQQALTALLDHHLLARAPGGQFQSHGLIREYAALRATQEDAGSDRRRAVTRLLDYYLSATDQADRVLHPFRRRMPVPVSGRTSVSPALATMDSAAGWLEAEWRSILQAAQYAGRHEWKQKCADLTHVLGGFLEVRAYWDDAIAAHTLAVQASRDVVDPARVARASLELSEVLQQTGQHDAALPLAEEAAEIYRSLADRRGEAEAVDQVGLAHQRAGRSRDSLAYFVEARVLYGGAEDPHGVADTLTHSGIASWQLGRCREAMDILRKALLFYRAAGDRRGEAKTLNNLGRMQLNSGYHRDALDGYQKALKIFQEIGAAQSEAILYHNIGGLHNYKGSYDKALAAYRRALAIYREIGDLPNEVDVLNDIGAIFQSAECYDEALICHDKAKAIAEEIGNLRQQVTAQRGVAGVRRGCGVYGEATDLYHSALKLAREIGDPYEEAKILEGIGETSLSTLRSDAARIAFRQALDIFERLDVPEAESARIRIEALDLAFSIGA